MARSTFGGTNADGVFSTFALGARQLLALSTATLTFWDAETGGTQYTDLLLNGSAVESISCPLGQVPAFEGPDSVTEMWADDGDGVRSLMVAQGRQGPAGPEGPAGAPGGSDAATADWVQNGPLTIAALSASIAAQALPLSDLVADYAPVDGPTFTKSLGDGRAGAYQFVNDDTDGYVMHFIPGPNFAGTSIVGMGTNPESTTGNIVILSNKGTDTHAIRLVNQDTVNTGRGIYGTHQGKGEFVFLESAVGAQGRLLRLSDASGALAASAGNLQDWVASTGVCGEVKADDGTLRWRKNVNAWAPSGTAARFVAASASTSLATASQAQLGGDIVGLQMYRYSGSSGLYYAGRLSSDGVRTVTLSMAHNAAAQGAESYITILQGKTAGISTPQIGFLGATPVSRQVLPAAGVVTADDIRTALINLGLCS